MRLLTYLTTSGTACGVLDGDRVTPLADPAGHPYDAVDALLAGGDLVGALERAVRGDALDLDGVHLLPPVLAPSKIVCAGVNYHDHRAEAGRPRAARPTVFTRFADTQVGHGEALVVPEVSDQLDYEGELALVVGRPAYRVEESEAFDVVAGYACYDDASVRDWQRHSGQWTAGKNFAGTGAFGPALVTPDEIADVGALTLTTTVNGEVRQHASVADMIFSVPALIAYVTTFTALAPGDVIVTGTPGGVGAFRSPPQYLRDGDVVEVAIPGVGTLRNPVVAAASAARGTASASPVGATAGAGRAG